MKKYIRAIVCIIYSLIRFTFIKLFHLNKFKFSLLSLVSPLTDISMDKNSKLYLGKMVKIRSGSKVRVRKDGIIKIGDNTSLNHGCIFTAHEKICIGQNVQFGPNVLIYDHDHDFRQKNGLKNLLYCTSSVKIGDDSWIGADVIILRGSSIGKNCVIAAGCIIKNDIPDNSIVIQKRDSIIIKKDDVNEKN